MNNNWKRAGHVVNVLFKHGLGYFVHELRLKWHLPFLKKLAPEGKPPSDLPVRLRKAMEELGGAYIKLGQFLSLRPDLLPPSYCDEFRKLLDEVPPMPFSKVRNVLETSLNAPVRTFFKAIDPQPIGSASIAQVHRAQLKSGRHVVIKIQRPEAKQQFAADIAIMYYLAHKMEKYFRNQAIAPVTIVKEFERYTAQELNFVLEARTIDRFAQHFKDSKTVVIPQVSWASTTGMVLTMSYLDGIKLTEVLKHPRQYPRALLAHRIADAIFEQVLDLGMFHADLHPGNILVLPGNRIGLLDFGIVGSLNEDLIKETVTIYSALVNKDIATVTNVLLKVGIPAPDADIEDLKRDVEHIVNTWYGTELGQARVTQMLQAIFESAVQHRIAMPVGFILLGKALVTVEGTCLALDPEFNFVEYSQPKITQLLREHRRPKAVLHQFTKMSKRYAELLAELPQQASDALERIKRGSVELNIRETDIKHIGLDINRSSNRLSYALIIASLLVSGALLIDVPPKIGAYSVFTVLGIAFALALLMVLLVSVVREGNEPFDPHREEKRTRQHEP
jgi:ubiquinone biosynthesis protein